MVKCVLYKVAFILPLNLLQVDSEVNATAESLPFDHCHFGPCIIFCGPLSQMSLLCCLRQLQQQQWSNEPGEHHETCLLAVCSVRKCLVHTNTSWILSYIHVVCSCTVCTFCVCLCMYVCARYTVCIPVVIVVFIALHTLPQCAGLYGIS